jgi:hypothetical protein
MRRPFHLVDVFGAEAEGMVTERMLELAQWVEEHVING